MTLHAAHQAFSARRAIVTTPKTLAGRITYDPALPPAHDQVLQREPMGSVLKVNAIYPTPFWRAAGLNGQAISDTGPIRITYDNSPPDGRPGVLVGFMEGNDSRAFYGAAPAARRQAALESFARYFGPQALHPVGYLDLMWAQEPFTPVLGETATSPAAATTVRVSAPAGLTLLMTGVFPYVDAHLPTSQVTVGR